MNGKEEERIRAQRELEVCVQKHECHTMTRHAPRLKLVTSQLPCLNTGAVRRRGRRPRECMVTTSVSRIRRSLYVCRACLQRPRHSEVDHEGMDQDGVSTVLLVCRRPNAVRRPHVHAKRRMRRPRSWRQN